MLTLNLGPFALAASHVLILGSFLLAMITGWWAGRRSGHNPEGMLFNLLLIALVVARLAFVITYAQHYRDDVWAIIDIRDGGFIAWPGVLTAVAWAGWQVRRSPGLRRPLGVALAVGLLGWGAGSVSLSALEQGARLPDLSLSNPEGSSVALHRYLGKPLVINIWASWCPPCRREMPVLKAAQQANPDVTFLFINQGESADIVNGFLVAQGLALRNVLLDRDNRLGRHVGSMALPTTLFYDVQGRQVGSHLGELSHASLAHVLNGLRADNQSAADKK